MRTRTIVALVAFLAIFVSSCKKNEGADLFKTLTQSNGDLAATSPKNAFQELKVAYVQSLSIPSQFLIEGTTIDMATFNCMSNSPTGVTIKSLIVALPANTSTSVSLTVDGTMISAANVTGNTAQFYGLNIVVPAGNPGVNIITGVTLNCIGPQQSECTGVSNSDVNITITSITFTNNSSGITKTTWSGAMSVNNKLVCTKPIVNMTASNEPGFVSGNIQIGMFTVSADCHGAIAISQIPVLIGIYGTATIVPETVELRSQYNNTVVVGKNGTNGTGSLSGSGNFILTTPRIISDGMSETYTVWATFSGVTGGIGTQSESFSLGQKSCFLWTDMVSNTTEINGTYILNWPTVSQVKTN
ncbi:MAG: hypothetical protein WCO07_01620 [bacterium]